MDAMGVRGGSQHARVRLLFVRYHLESRWRNSHVLVYHSPFTKPPFGGCAIYCPDGIIAWKWGRHPYQSNSNCQVLHLSLFGRSYLGFRRPISGTRAIHGNFSLDICLYPAKSTRGKQKRWTCSIACPISYLFRRDSKTSFSVPSEVVKV